MKVTSTIAIVALATFGLFSCQSNNTSKEKTEAMQSIPEQDEAYFISVDSANEMIQSYLTSIQDSNSDNPSLQSLIVDAGALRDYLSDTSITKVKIMFAHTMQYINEGHDGQPAGYKPNALTIVIAGFNVEGNYVTAPGRMVPDRARPCPSDCPTTGNAANPLIQ